MSIWSSRTDIGAYDLPGEEDKPPGEVRSYAEGWSNHYPTDDVEKPAFVGTASIPPWCVPGHFDDPASEDMATGPWLRLHVATWNEDYGMPMIANGATVILDVEAARSLAAELLSWAEERHIEPTAHDPASGPEPATGAPGTAGVDAGTGEAGSDG